MKKSTSIWLERKGEHTALGLIILMTDAKSSKWFDSFFKEELARDPEFLRELAFNLGSVPEGEIFSIQGMLVRLFCDAETTKDFRWDGNGHFWKSMIDDSGFLQEVVLNVGKAPRAEVRAIQPLLIEHFRPQF